MMRKEIVDKKSGAILFKKTQDAKNLDYALKEIEALKKENSTLKGRITKLENALKEGKDS